MITLNRLCQLCHISKEKAKWLLDNKVIPCEDLGKKTHRYKIKTDDAIAYLQSVKRNGDNTPVGIFSSRYRKNSKVVDEFPMLYEYLKEDAHVTQLREYYAKLFKHYPNGLTTAQVAQMTGVHINTVNAWIKGAHLNAYRGKPNRIPKTYVLDFLCSDYCVRNRMRSALQRKHLLKFIEQFVKKVVNGS